MNFRFSSIVILTIVLGFYIIISNTLIQNSMASTNQSIEVTEHTDGSSIFSSLSRNFDETLVNINDKHNDNSTKTANEDGEQDLQG